MVSTVGMLIAGTALIVGALVVCGLLYQAAGVRGDARHCPPPGVRVDVGGFRLHARVLGSGSPVVVFESGLGASSINWTRVQEELAALTCVVAYDRAGFAWSDASPEPRRGAVMVRELHALLARVGADPPYVLVGHSFGGLLVRSYYRRYAEQIAGLVFVDATFPHEWLNMPRERRRLVRGGRLFARIRLGLTG